MDVQDKTLTCLDCGRQFLFTSGEQEFFAHKGFTNTPGRCRECRAARRASRDGGQRRNRRMTGAPLDIQPATTAVRQTHSKDGIAVRSPDTDVMREVTELSYRCDVLAVEKAKLEREKASLLEKMGVLANERDYLKNALAAALSRSVPISEKEEGLASRPWWKRIFG